MDEATLFRAYSRARRVDTKAGERCATPACKNPTEEDGTFFCPECRAGIAEILARSSRYDRDA